MGNNNNTYQVNTYNRYATEFVKGDGVYLYDKSGKKYLDLLSGIAVTGLGHKNKKLVNAAVSQINNLWHVSNLFKSTPQEELAKKISLKSGLDKVFFCNSGTEANEAAIKFARKFGKNKSTIITANGGFHGRTMGSLSASAQNKLWEGFHPLTPGFNHTSYNNIEALKNAIDNKTIAIMIEPVQGENGIVIPSRNYLKEIRDLCNKKKLLMIIDEIQTGFGRTGKFFAYQHSNIVPDIVTVAKGIANGLPLGAVICSNKVANSIKPGNHGSTFGGNPIAVAVANEVVELITEEVLENINTLEHFIKNKFTTEHLTGIEEIRIMGLMIGIKLNDEIDVKKLASALLKNGIIVGTAGNNILRLLPPLIIEKEHIEKFIYIFKKILNQKIKLTKVG